MAERRAVLVMAYGTPRGLDDVEAYYADIRGGRPPSPELLDKLTERYRAIGGRSPLLEITEAQTRGIEDRLDGVRAYLGQKHATPFIADAVEAMAAEGIERAAGLVLAPHYSSMSVGDYARRAGRAAEESGWSGKLEMIESWHLEPGYVAWLGDRVRDALASLPEDTRASTTVVFSAHSLPGRILETGDPYPAQLAETAEAVAGSLGLERWRVGWQSAGRTAETWIGPDILEVVREHAEAGGRGVVVCPCGFVADHLEVLYDIDIEAARLAEALGISLRRTEAPNADPGFLDMLAAVVARALS
ncbi:MAG: ferrochelatase [Actinomycetota bacterium]